MKICLVSPYDYAYPGGVVSHVKQLANQLTLKGHQVKIIAPVHSVPEGSEHLIAMGRPIPFPGVDTVTRISLSVWLTARVRKVLKKEQFDVIHLHEPLSPFVPLAVLRESESLNIGTFHAFHGSKHIYRFTGFLLRPFHNKLHGHIAVSEPARKFINKSFPADYTIIPNGIDYEHFNKPLSKLPQFDDGKINLLFVGRLEKRKGLPNLLNAYAILKWRYPNLRLIIVGPGTLNFDCHSIISSRNLQDLVFVGGVSYDELPRYYQTADIFCAPSLGGESFGIVLLEAMAARTPTIASNIDGYREVLTDGKEGLLIEPDNPEDLADGISKLIDDPALRSKMKLAGPKTAVKYRWEVIADQVEEYYVQLLSSR